MCLGFYLIGIFSLFGFLLFVRHCIFEREFQGIQIGDEIIVGGYLDCSYSYIEVVVDIYTDEDGYTMVVITDSGHEFNFNDFLSGKFTIC